MRYRYREPHIDPKQLVETVVKIPKKPQATLQRHDGIPLGPVDLDVEKKNDQFRTVSLPSVTVFDIEGTHELIRQINQSF